MEPLSSQARARHRVPAVWLAGEQYECLCSRALDGMLDATDTSGLIGQQFEVRGSGIAERRVTAGDLLSSSRLGRIVDSVFR